MTVLVKFTYLSAEGTICFPALYPKELTIEGSEDMKVDEESVTLCLRLALNATKAPRIPGLKIGWEVWKTKAASVH